MFDTVESGAARAVCMTQEAVGKMLAGSKMRITFRFAFGGAKEHFITISHSLLSCKKVIVADGETVSQEKVPGEFEFSLRFHGHLLKVIVQGPRHTYDLLIDGVGFRDLPRLSTADIRATTTTTTTSTTTAQAATVISHGSSTGVTKPTRPRGARRSSADSTGSSSSRRRRSSSASSSSTGPAINFHQYADEAATAIAPPPAAPTKAARGRRGSRGTTPTAGAAGGAATSSASPSPMAGLFDAPAALTGSSSPTSFTGDFDPFAQPAPQQAPMLAPAPTNTVQPTKPATAAAVPMTFEVFATPKLPASAKPPAAAAAARKPVTQSQRDLHSLVDLTNLTNAGATTTTATAGPRTAAPSCAAAAAGGASTTLFGRPVVAVPTVAAAPAASDDPFAGLF